MASRRTQLFDFDLHDKDTLIEINRPGIVNGLLFNEYGPKYQVIYWNDCQRKDEWVYGWEIKLKEETA